MSLSAQSVPIRWQCGNVSAVAILTLPRSDAGRPGEVLPAKVSTIWNGHFEKGHMPKADGKSIVERIAERYEVDPQTGCWNWTAGKNSWGYGYIWTGPRRKADTRAAHIVSYEFKYGPVPVWLELDHKCRNRGCVNPDHLEAVTRKTNAYNSDINPVALNARKTACKRGHEFTPENTNITKQGGRRCIACSRSYRSRKVG